MVVDEKNLASPKHTNNIQSTLWIFNLSPFVSIPLAYYLQNTNQGLRIKAVQISLTFHFLTLL